MAFSTGVFDTVQPSGPLRALPARLTLTPDLGKTTSRLLLIMPALGLLLAPAAVAAVLLARADIAVLVREQPMTFAALAGQPVLCLLLAALAAWSIAPRLRRRRFVLLEAGAVSVAETTLRGAKSWREPLRSYRGLAHNVRATLGGVHHELILVHPRASRSVLLHTAPAISQAHLEHYCRLLGVGQVAAREVYRLEWPGAARVRAVPADGALAGSGVLAATV